MNDEDYDEVRESQEQEFLEKEMEDYEEDVMRFHDE